MNSRNKIGVLFVEDHAIVRDGLAAILAGEADIEVVFQAGSAEEALAQFAKAAPDITLMDLRLPGMSGIAAIQEIRRMSPDARIIVLSTYDSEEDIYRAIEAGARGYLLKAMLRHQLLDAIRSVHNGAKYIPPQIAARIADRVGREDLSRREHQILTMLANGKSNREISEALAITEGSVRIHVSNILAKLGVKDRTQAVVSALKRGIVRLD